MSPAKKKARAYIGCSGFVYRHWRGVFYPEELSQYRWLEYYAEKFDTVELNVTFYRLPNPSSFKSWKKRTPDDFIFVIKGSKLITHQKMLKDVESAVDELIERASLLEAKLGPILWQLKPSHKIDLEVLKDFTALLKEKYPNLRHAFEFRNKTWFEPEVYKILKKANMTFCHADWPTNLPQPSDDFPYIYIRRHGPEGQAYRGCYSEKQLKDLAKKIKKWLNQGKDVYVYFNNDIEGYAPQNALQLKKLIEG